MRTIVLNTLNIVPDGNNNSLVYKFPNSVLFKNTYVAVQSVSMYYSWYNISSALGNNILQFYFPNTSGVMTLQTVTFPDGLYEVKDLDAYFQYFCLQNGFYYTTTGGDNVFFMTITVNLSLYAIQICAYTTPYVTSPTTIGNPNGWIPAFGTAIPATAQTIQPVIVPNFNQTIGWPTGSWTGFNWANASSPTSSGTYLGVPYSWNATTGVVAYTSPNSPQVQPNGSIYISLNNINNPYAIPSTTIYAITPTGVAGSAVIEKPPQFCWNKFIDGTYNQLTLTLLGTNGTPIQIKDPQMTILLAIKDGDEWAGKG